MLVTSYLLGWFLSHLAAGLDLSNHLDQLRSVKEALKGTAAADYFDCPSERFVLEVSSRINLCSLNNDEKTRCGKSSRSMKMGGVRYIVPCKYDMNTHTCIENYNCNVPIIGTKRAQKQLKDRTTGVRTSKKVRTKKNEKFVYAPLEEDDSQGCTSLHDLMGTRESMGWNGGCIASSEGDCEKMYYSKLITGQAWKVPCIWMNNICQDDMTCALMTSHSGTHGELTGHPSFGNTTRPSYANYTTSHPSPYRTIGPSAVPTVSTDIPTRYPSNPPTYEPTRNPTHDPSIHPTPNPTRNPTFMPTSEPTDRPTPVPTSEPTMEPTPVPTDQPTAEPTDTPTANPTFEPTQEPTNTPTAAPTFEPTNNPTATPTAEPTDQPTEEPTPSPTFEPTAMPTTAEPTFEPSEIPTAMPTEDPTIPVDTDCIDIFNRKDCVVNNGDRCEWDKILQFCLPLTQKPTEVETTAKPTARPSRFPTNPPTKFEGDGDKCEAYNWKFKGIPGLSRNDGVCCDALCPKCQDSGCQDYGNDKYGVPFGKRCCPTKIKKSSDFKNKRCDKGDTPPCRTKSKNQQCPCQPAQSQEPEGCSPEHLEKVIPEVFSKDQVEEIAEARKNYDDSTAQWTFERTLLNTGIVNIWEVMLWYGHANCDPGIFDDIKPAPVKICLWESKASFHLVQNEQKENNLLGLQKNRLKLKFKEGEKPITLLKCAQEVAAEFIDEQGNSEELKMFSWQVDTNRAKYDTSRCTSFGETDTAPLEESSDRAGSYVYSKEWLCPFPNVFEETCGAPDVFGTVLNPRVVDVGITDDACLCQTMCEERSAEDAKDFVAWNLQTQEGRCVCVYVGEKDEKGTYRTVDKINNLSGAMNGFKLQSN